MKIHRNVVAITLHSENMQVIGTGAHLNSPTKALLLGALRMRCYWHRSLGE